MCRREHHGTTARTAGARPWQVEASLLPHVCGPNLVVAQALLDRINETVNRGIVPVTNFDHWGTMLDRWDYPVDGKIHAL